jgi:hypothetical protein
MEPDITEKLPAIVQQHLCGGFMRTYTQEEWSLLDSVQRSTEHETRDCRTCLVCGTTMLRAYCGHCDRELLGEETECKGCGQTLG